MDDEIMIPLSEHKKIMKSMAISFMVVILAILIIEFLQFKCTLEVGNKFIDLYFSSDYDYITGDINNNSSAIIGGIE